jgi:hypothetical protein
MNNAETSVNVFAEALTPAQRDLLTAKTAPEFNAAFSTIILEAVRGLEKDTKNLGGLSEDGLSTVLALALNGTKALIVSREESSNGHVDLTFKAPLCKPPREVLGEAKIFRYYDWHESGLSQLVKRYSTGREDRGLLLEYVKLAGIKDHMKKLRADLDAKLPCNQVAKCSDHETVTQWSFCSSHKHSSGEQIEVWHFGCNLYQPQKEPAPKNDAKTSSAK